jgi:hypothetical protein
MEDYIIREIDRIGELLLKVARKMGLFLDDVPQYTISDIKSEMEKLKLSLDIDAILAEEAPIMYLVEKEKLSDNGLEAFVELIYHSDLDESKKTAVLNEALNYLDGKGNYSFRLHSLSDN